MEFKCKESREAGTRRPGMLRLQAGKGPSQQLAELTYRQSWKPERERPCGIMVSDTEITNVGSLHLFSCVVCVRLCKYPVVRSEARGGHCHCVSSSIPVLIPLRWCPTESGTRLAANSSHLALPPPSLGLHVCIAMPMLCGFWGLNQNLCKPLTPVHF